MNELKQAVIEKNRKDAKLTQALWDAITAKGQKKKVLKDAELKAMLIRAGVDISDAE